jgi:hypothetical protein
MLSTLDRLSVHVPGVLSTSELEAVRSVLTEAVEADGLRQEVMLLREARDKDTENFNEHIEWLKENHDYTRRQLRDEQKRMSDAFHYDGPIGNALILLRDATMSRPDETWLRSAIGVLNDLFKYSPDLTPWKPGDEAGDEPERPFAPPSPERQQLLDRFEEAVAVHRIPGNVARAVEILIRAAETEPSYDGVLAKLTMEGLDSQAATLLCDLVFMQDGEPDDKDWGMADNSTEESDSSPTDSSEDSSEEE